MRGVFFRASDKLELLTVEATISDTRESRPALHTDFSCSVHSSVTLTTRCLEGPAGVCANWGHDTPSQGQNVNGI